MKEKLLQLLKNNPATAGRPDEFLETLVDDIQAAIIRAISPGNTDDAVEALQQEVDELYGSPFGIKLFNMYAIEEFPGKKQVTFAARKRIIRAALETLLVEQCIDYTGDLDDVMTLTASSPDGPTLKRRLLELSTAPKGMIN